MKTAAMIALACSTAMMALAQTQLTKAQEGRREVGRCYSECTARYASASVATARSFSNWQEVVISDAFANLDPATQAATEEVLRLLFCGLSGVQVEDMRSCRDGCIDVEAAYGVRSSRARSRFLRLFNEETASVGEPGTVCEDILGEFGSSAAERLAMKAPPRAPVRPRAAAGNQRR